MAFSNKDKSQHGQSGISGLRNLLELCLQRKYIKTLTPEFRIGKEGFTNANQFYAPFVIEFNDETNSKWALFSSTSMRTDRIKGQQWDAFNLKTIDPTISNAYLVFPDSISEGERKNFINQNNKYRSREEFSALDGILSQQQLFNLIESHALGSMTTGQIKDIQGNSFEEMVARTLQYKQNLEKWCCHTPTIEGMNYSLFEVIVNGFNLAPTDTQSIMATSDKAVIGKLPSGGSPKTDVFVGIDNMDGTHHSYTISCKRSSASWVSVHQYTADVFSDVLDENNDRLRRLLNLFQAAGSMGGMDPNDKIALEKELQPYIEPLCMWVLGGLGGPAESPRQYANFILTYDNTDNSARIHRVQDYCRILMDNVDGNFGTPFHWTYPSKQRGNYIQLKCKILK